MRIFTLDEEKEENFHIEMKKKENIHK